MNTALIQQSIQQSLREGLESSSSPRQKNKHIPEKPTLKRSRPVVILKTRFQGGEGRAGLELCMLTVLQPLNLVVIFLHNSFSQCPKRNFIHVSVAHVTHCTSPEAGLSHSFKSNTNFSRNRDILTLVYTKKSLICPPVLILSCLTISKSDRSQK